MTSTPEVPLRFPPSSENTQGAYKLLELPPELCKIVEGGLETQFTIRGRAADDAVLCTRSKTYALRAVTLSNTLVVATAPSGASAAELIVRDQVSQILELVPSVPKLHRLGTALRGCEYDEGHERDDEEGSEEEDAGERPRKRARFTRENIRGEVQASDSELAQGIKNFHILEIDGHLRPLAPSYLTHILELLLNALVSQGLPLPPRAVRINKLAYHLDLEHEIPRRVTEQVLSWFGDVEGSGEDGQWKMNTQEVVKQIGLGHLMSHKEDPAKVTDFLERWSAAVGDTFASSVDIALLEGNYLLAPAPTPGSMDTPTHLSYFPASALPVTATLLFADLFLTRPRWRATDITPFLSTVAVDAKERDKLLMKYARSTTDADGGVWYTARATHV